MYLPRSPQPLHYKHARLNGRSRTEIPSTCEWSNFPTLHPVAFFTGTRRTTRHRDRYAMPEIFLLEGLPLAMVVALAARKCTACQRAGRTRDHTILDLPPVAFLVCYFPIPKRKGNLAGQIFCLPLRETGSTSPFDNTFSIRSLGSESYLRGD